MSTNHPFSQGMQEIFFKVIRFVENEKLESVILLFKVNERLSFMLDISIRFGERLKSEMREIENKKLQVIRRIQNLRLRLSSSLSSFTASINTMVVSVGGLSIALTRHAPNPDSNLTELEMLIFLLG